MVVNKKKSVKSSVDFAVVTNTKPDDIYKILEKYRNEFTNPENAKLLWEIIENSSIHHQGNWFYLIAFEPTNIFIPENGRKLIENKITEIANKLINIEYFPDRYEVFMFENALQLILNKPIYFPNKGYIKREVKIILNLCEKRKPFIYGVDLAAAYFLAKNNYKISKKLCYILKNDIMLIGEIERCLNL